MRTENDNEIFIDTGNQSSLIASIWYGKHSYMMFVNFKVIYKDEIYKNVPLELFEDFANSQSLGKFFNEYIKNKFKTKKQTIMADKTYLGSIDLRKINKDVLLEGKKDKDGHIPLYMNFKLLLNDKEDKFGSNGFMAQTVPKKLRADFKNAEVNILGNVKDFTDYGRENVEKPGEESGEKDEGVADDLPF